MRFYLKNDLSILVKKKLLGVQLKNVIETRNILITKYICLNASEMGAGKTYIACGLASEMKRSMLVICPKIAIPGWLKVMKIFGVERFDVINYETLVNCKTYKNDNYVSRNPSEYIQRTSQGHYEWNLQKGKCLTKDVLVVFDESHKCRSPKTGAGKLLYSTKQLIDNKIPVLLLSATMSEQPKDMKIPLYLMGKIDSLTKFNIYSKELIIEPIPIEIEALKGENKEKAKKKFIANQKSMAIREDIIEYFTRITRKEIHEYMPENNIIGESYESENSDKINAAYDEIKKKIEEIKNTGYSHGFGEINKKRQEIEYLKVPIFIDLAKKYIAEGKSVIIFLNYLDPMEIIRKEFNTDSIINGSMNLREKFEVSEKFQRNESKILISQIRAGGISISLHDIIGDSPRIVLISLPPSGNTYVQSIGRAHRMGGKSVVKQIIVLVKNVPYEEKMKENLNVRLSNISSLNDREKDMYEYDTTDKVQ